MDDFDWNNYLETIKGTAVPEELFLHVEASLNNGIKQGMLLEVCHKNNPDMYWIAKITMVCGHLLRIKFIGATTDFWCDISTTKVHPLGWCGKYDELVEPPDEINEKYGDTIIEIMKQALVDGQSVSIEALNNKGLSPIDRIKVGMKVEVQNILDPYKYWIATVCENVGGRLLLRYDGADEDLPPIWIFFSNPRLSSFGYVTNKGSPWQFKYPGKVNKFSCKIKLSTQLRLSAEESIKEPTPPDLFQPIHSIKAHNFTVGMKLEALSPVDMTTIRPATVAKVFNNLHFVVAIDDYIDDYESARMAWLCDADHPYIYPIGWAARNNFTIKPPKVWKEPVFNWDVYLNMTSSTPAPEHCFGKKTPLEGLEVNMKLEAVNPHNHEEIHVASIEAIAEHMVCVELQPIGEKFWYSQDSDMLLPVGWCDSNSYALHIPDLTAKKEPEVKEKPMVVKEKKPPEEWCDRIYFNYKCYAGPSISRNKLSQLPKHVGPGPLSLVLKEVLNKIISASYKPAKLLKDWETEGPPEEGMRLEMLRAKLKTSTYHAYVSVAASSALVRSFCAGVCARLHACPALFGPDEYPLACPHRCRTVDKATFHNGTERRGRPKGMIGRRRKRKGNQDKRDKEQPHDKDESVSDCTPPSPHDTRPSSPDDDKRPRPAEQTNSYSNARADKLTNYALQNKRPHWDKKHAQYNSKRGSHYSDTENESSTNSRDKNISDVSDGEEPELKKLKFSSYEEQPSDNLFEKDAAAWTHKLKLAANPLDWSVDDVHAYLRSTDDCRLVADRMRQEEIDGQAFLMLDGAAIRQFLHMKQEFALAVAKHIDMMRWHALQIDDSCQL